MTLAVAESLTGGLLCSHFARMDDAADWFRGGIVAYCRPVKEELLHIGESPVISENAACAMADNAAKVLGATVAAAVTGVGGPDDQDGIPAGTVWIGVRTPARTRAQVYQFVGDPEEVCRQTCAAAEQQLATSIMGHGDPRLAREELADHVVVRIVGDLDVDTALELRNALAPDGHRPIVVDLAETTFMDSHGLNALVAAWHRGSVVAVRDPSPTVRRLIEISGLREMVEIDP